MTGGNAAAASPIDMVADSGDTQNHLYITSQEEEEEEEEEEEVKWSRSGERPSQVIGPSVPIYLLWKIHLAFCI
jgi:hypothetical protein